MASMDTASKVLIVGGVMNLALSFVLGFLLSRQRLADPQKDARLLLQTHRVTLWEGFMLLGLVFAVQLSTLSPGLELGAAWLLVASAAFQDAGAITNWLRLTQDYFAERSLGLYLNVINAVLGTIGLAILIVGVFKGL